MEALDCDKGLLRSGNLVAARDIVQVPILPKVTNICNLQILNFCYF
jgi:hypothetical protein